MQGMGVSLRVHESGVWSTRQRSLLRCCPRHPMLNGSGTAISAVSTAEVDLGRQIFLPVERMKSLIASSTTAHVRFRRHDRSFWQILPWRRRICPAAAGDGLLESATSGRCSFGRCLGRAFGRSRNCPDLRSPNHAPAPSESSHFMPALPLSPRELIDRLDSRHDELIAKLDELNAQIEAALAEFSRARESGSRRTESKKAA